jgi:saccharopine dehydrogenase-like NADP-dependent oxidoreductase
MCKFLLVGAGKIGEMIADLLSNTGDYDVTVADNNPQALKKMSALKNVSTLLLDVTDRKALQNAVKGQKAVLCALPYHLTGPVAEAAANCAVNYFDLTEDVEGTRRVRTIAEGASSAIMPQCGLAPGFVSIVANDLADDFDEVHDVRLRVGALPQYPSNALKYNLTWSTEGVINEYCNPCEAIRDGKIREIMPLEGKESFALDGIDYEAFNTSGGLGTLCETMSGDVRNLDYKSVRYPGHCDIAKLLIRDLQLNSRRDLLKEILDEALPHTLQDVVVIFVTVSGIKKGKLVQQSFAKKIYAQEIQGRQRGAIQITTAASACAIIDMMQDCQLPDAGFIKQEQVKLDAFLGNRFGQYYA